MSKLEEKPSEEVGETTGSQLEVIASSIAEGDWEEDAAGDITNNAETATPENGQEQQQQQQDSDNASNTKKPVKLYKSSRLKGYITLALASFINFDAAQKSGNVDENILTVVPSTDDQRRYAEAVAVVSLILASFCLVVHLDRVTPLEKFWISHLFAPDGSKFEGALVFFLTVWWSVATGVATSITGIAGDGKGQYSLYYSNWTCCLTSYWVLERWWVAAGWSSLKSFISSWPYRSPAWIMMMVLSFFTLIWYLDLWQNHSKLDRPSEIFIIEHFDAIGNGQWQWLIIVAVFTFCPSVVFVLIELFRETKADGSNTAKSNTEVVIEGVCFLTLVLAWIPTVLIATTPRGAASLIGNAYFFTWIMTIFVFEGFIWYIHDKRKETHYALKEKEDEYHQRQRKVLEQTRAIQRKHEEGEDEMEFSRRPSTEFFDPVENLPESRARFAS